jgi:uncharacterized OB-fold protein
MSANPARAVAEDIFVGAGRSARLVAGRRKADGKLVFPFPSAGAASDYERVQLGREGTLWSWTVQRFAPKQPYNGPSGADFKPYAVGYIELSGELIVESRLLVPDFERLRIGMPMRLTTLVYRHDELGPVLTYAFEPAEPT